MKFSALAVITFLSIGAYSVCAPASAEPGKERFEIWAIPGGATCQRILDKILDDYGTSVQIRTNRGVFQ